MTVDSDNQLHKLKTRVVELEKKQSDYNDLLVELEQYKREEQSSTQFQEKLKILNEISIELDRTQSFDELCYLGIELGLFRLGFDRLSLWFLDDSGEYMVGTYGVDEQGHIRDERQARWRFTGEIAMGFWDRTKDIVINEDADLLNQKSEIIGKGWHVSVPLLNGDEFVGFMAADNLISRQPLEPYQPELLQILGSTIGYLARSKQEQVRTNNLLHVIDQSSNGIIVLDIDGTIQYVNPTFIKLFKLPIIDVFDHTLESLCTLLGVGDYYADIWESLGTHGQWHTEWHRQVEGHHMNLQVSISTVHNPNGSNPTQYVAQIDDVTSRRLIEKQEIQLRIEQERAKLLETFITHISHDFKTALSVIKTKLFVLDKLIQDEKTHPYLMGVNEQTDLMNLMLDDMMTMIRLDSGIGMDSGLTEVSLLVQMAFESVQVSSQDDHLQWRMSLSEGLYVKGDEQWLVYAIIQLLQNAIEYTSGQGRITITVKSDNENISISIEDTGTGIPENEFENIFKPLYRVDKARTKRTTGLGLSIVNKIIQLHHGTITVKSQLGEGSEFIINLPSAL